MPAGKVQLLKIFLITWGSVAATAAFMVIGTRNFTVIGPENMQLLLIWKPQCYLYSVPFEAVSYTHLLRKIVQNALERNVKKYQLQQKQLKDTEKKEKYRVWGELLNTYGYEVEPGAKSMEALNYYTNEMIQIPLDETMTPQENAKKYFDKYSKLKQMCIRDSTTAGVRSFVIHTHGCIHTGVQVGYC